MKTGENMIILNKDTKTIEFVGDIYLEDFLHYLDEVFEEGADISEYRFSDCWEDEEYN